METIPGFAWKPDWAPEKIMLRCPKCGDVDFMYTTFGACWICPNWINMTDDPNPDTCKWMIPLEGFTPDGFDLVEFVPDEH